MLLRFDLSTLPSGVRVQQALLRVQVLALTPFTPTAIEVYQLYRPWEITAATWNRASGQEEWAAPGAASALDRSQTPAGVAPLAAAGEVVIDITSLVQAWADGAANHGLLLRLDQKSVQNLSLASLDNLALGQRPQLELFLATK